jgi:hypothetical protein
MGRALTPRVVHKLRAELGSGQRNTGDPAHLDGPFAKALALRTVNKILGLELRGTTWGIDHGSPSRHRVVPGGGTAYEGHAPTP